MVLWLLPYNVSYFDDRRMCEAVCTVTTVALMTELCLVDWCPADKAEVVTKNFPRCIERYRKDSAQGLVFRYEAVDFTLQKSYQECQGAGQVQRVNQMQWQAQ